MPKTARVTFALLFGVSLSNPALAAGCATPADASALKTAVMQQELMVAAFQCHEADAYNRFVSTYRGELQSSDAALKAFFIRRGGEHGEAGYDTFKTKAANLSALDQARHGGAFCADAHALFVAALNNPGSLISFVESRSSAINTGDICVESRPVLADEPRVPRAAATASQARVKVAQANETAVHGVPVYSAPAMPYRRTDQSSARSARGDMARNEDVDDAQASYANDENPPPRSYGPPPGWQPQGWRPYPPPPRWYSRDPYER
jgi:hypothetical protein